jgi:hypothetical protein
MPSYSWLTFISARQQLAQRLYDPGMVFTIDAELGIYLQQALRMFNTLTFTWKQDYVFNPVTLWNSLATLPGSPRLRTQTDTDCYTQLEYMLLEPPTGATWTGTPQFSVDAFALALQRCRDEMLKVSNCNQQLVDGIPSTPNTRRTVLPDNVIEVARVRWLPAPSGFPVALYRDDTVAQEFYEPGFWQAAPGTPQTFMLTSEPPLSWDVDIPPSVPGTYEAVELLAGTPFAPPAATLLNVPDDYAWVLIWGALADLLGRESEATDRQRSDYCLKRYIDGLTLLLKTPWAMLVKITGRATTPVSIANADRYSPGWDLDPSSLPFIVTGGIDFFAAPTGTSVGLTVLGNAPIPVLDGDFVQVSRANWDTVLDLAQVFAGFKMGGQDFQDVLEVEQRALQACSAENQRLKSTGAFADILIQRGGAQDREQERYASAPAQSRAKG